MTPETVGAAVAQPVVELTDQQTIPISRGRQPGAENLRIFLTNG